MCSAFWLPYLFLCTSSIVDPLSAFPFSLLPLPRLWFFMLGNVISQWEQTHSFNWYIYANLLNGDQRLKFLLTFSYLFFGALLLGRYLCASMVFQLSVSSSYALFSMILLIRKLASLLLSIFIFRCASIYINILSIYQIYTDDLQLYIYMAKGSEKGPGDSCS